MTFARKFSDTALPVRRFYAALFVVSFCGLVLEIFTTATGRGGPFLTPGARVANMISYFTIDSNLLVMVLSLLVAARGLSASKVFSVAWLDGFIAIIVTGVVYQVALSGLYDIHGLTLFADIIVHKVVPIAFAVGWLLTPQARLPGWWTIGWALVYPLTWLGLTLVRGELTGFYPYPFVDVDANGGLAVAVNCLVIAALFLLLAYAGLEIQRAVTRRRTAK
ncbi:Pr6Pr family membrane protein [Amycolatopsis sp. NPDC004378]